jgi:hypothetical protein
VTAREFLLQAMRIWAIESVASAATIIRKAGEFDLAVNYGDVAQAHPDPVRLVESRLKQATRLENIRKRSQSVPRPRGEPQSDAFLPVSKALKLWGSASFLVQRYGLFLNTRMLIRYSELGVRDPDQASQLLTALFREWRQRFDLRNANEATDLHWLYCHEWNEEYGLQTRLVAHVPSSVDDSGNWIRERFLIANRGMSSTKSAVLYRRFAQTSLKLHHYLAGLVCRGVEKTAKGEAFVFAAGIRRKVAGSIGNARMKQRCAVSRAIDTASQAAASSVLSVITPTTKKHWHLLRSGWELPEFHYRSSLISDRKAAEDRIHREFEGKLRSSELARFLEEYRQSEHARDRDRPGCKLII